MKLAEYSPHYGQMAFHHACNNLYQFVAMISGIRGGKCLVHDQEVLMSDGTKKKASDIRRGDRVLGFNPETGESVPCTVTDTDITVKNTAEYVLSDKSKIKCSTDHAFPCWNAKRKKFVEYPISEIARRSDNYLYLLGSQKVDFENQKELPIDPYILGVILGDCNISQNYVRIMNPDREVIECFAGIEGVEVKARTVKDTYGIVSRQRDSYGYTHNPLVSDLRSLGLLGCNSHTKFIPKEYLISTEHDRRQLLAGLVDTDGYVEERGRIEYCTTSEHLASGVIFMLRSLGIRASILKRTTDTNFKQGCVSFRITWTGGQLPLRVERKKNRLKDRIKQSSHRVYIESQKDLGEDICFDISIDHPTHLFLLDNFIATHNTHAGARQAGRDAWNSKAPRQAVYGIIAPTYNMLDRTTWREFKIAIEPLIAKDTDSKKIITLKNGREVHGFSAENPDRIRNATLCGFWLDEGRECKQGIWDILLGRVLSTGGKGILTTSPNSYDWIHDVFIAEKKKNHGVVKFTSFDNTYLDQERISDLEANYDPKFARQELYGEFVIFEGAVYYAFTRKDNAGDLAFKLAQYDPMKPICLCADFNVNPMFWVLAQVADNNGLKEIRVFDEMFIRNTNTVEACQEFKSRYPNHRSGVILYGDATGQQRHTDSNVTNWKIIENELSGYGITKRVPLKNPNERDRINAVNGMICNSRKQRRLLINPNCKRLIGDLEQVAFKEGTTQIDKNRNMDLTHGSDALGYMVEKDFSLAKGRIEGLKI
jgi:phage terminase large subunit